MRGVPASVLLVVAAVALWLPLHATRVGAGQVPCPTIISRINHQISVEHGRAADLSALAKQLGTSIPWVEHCMTTYGRRPKRPGLESAENLEERLEGFEEAEPEEVGPEEVEEGGTQEPEPHKERERGASKHVTPTPSGEFY